MDKKKVAKRTQSKLFPIKVPVKFNIPDNIITRFATNMTVQIIENEFKISFFEQFPPIRLSQAEPPPKEVQANCVASVVVTVDRLPRFIEALQVHLQLYNSREQPKK